MTTQPQVPLHLPRASELAAASHGISARMLGSARRLSMRGIMVVAAAALLGVAEAVSLWMGALLVGVGLLVVAGVFAIIGLIGRLGPGTDRR